MRLRSRLLWPAFFAPIPCAVNDAQNRDGFVALGFIAKGVGDDVGHTAHHFFIGAGHAPVAACGRGRKGLNSSIDTGGYAVGSGRIVLRDIANDAAKIIVGVF